MKLTTRPGTAAVDGLNEALLAKAVQANCGAQFRRFHRRFGKKGGPPASRLHSHLG